MVKTPMFALQVDCAMGSFINGTTCMPCTGVKDELCVKGEQCLNCEFGRVNCVLEHTLLTLFLCV